MIALAYNNMQSMPVGKINGAICHKIGKPFLGDHPIILEIFLSGITRETILVDRKLIPKWKSFDGAKHRTFDSRFYMA